MWSFLSYPHLICISHLILSLSVPPSVFVLPSWGRSVFEDWSKISARICRSHVERSLRQLRHTFPHLSVTPVHTVCALSFYSKIKHLLECGKILCEYVNSVNLFKFKTCRRIVVLHCLLWRWRTHSRKSTTAGLPPNWTNRGAVAMHNLVWLPTFQLQQAL